MPTGLHWITLQRSDWARGELHNGSIGRPLVAIVAAVSTERPLGAAWHVELREVPLSLSFTN